MSTRGMTADVEALAIAAELLRILIDPGDGAPHLLGHDAEIAAGLLHRHEVERDVMRAGVHEHFGRKSVSRRRTAQPRPAMNEDIDWRIRGFGAEDVELFRLGRSIGDALRLAEPGTRRRAR